MKAKYILWSKSKFASHFTPEEFDSKENMATAILTAASCGGEYIMTRRMEINIKDSNEAELSTEEVAA